MTHPDAYTTGEGRSGGTGSKAYATRNSGLS